MISKSKSYLMINLNLIVLIIIIIIIIITPSLLALVTYFLQVLVNLHDKLYSFIILFSTVICIKPGIKSLPNFIHTFLETELTKSLDYSELISVLMCNHPRKTIYTLCVMSIVVYSAYGCIYERVYAAVSVSL